MAQDATQVPAAVAQTAEEEDEGGFDDWGLLGLLGLIGLAGLRRREPKVRRVDRTAVDRTNDVRR
ncbi:MAG: WGxxGxxG-CTERM domain-containing protein [Chloroflexia bacterium]|nr:WGxxGxxG-CTERM domain-containing protein [Chloroflexia bacterium]